MRRSAAFSGCFFRLPGRSGSYPLWLLSLFFLLRISPLQAQNTVFSNDSLVLVEKTIMKLSKNARFTILPGPVYNSTNKLGFMILPVVVYKVDREDSISPPSSTALAIYFDFNGSWSVAARQNFYWNQNKWRAYLSTGYGDFRLKFFGIGRDTTIINNNDSNYVWCNMKGFKTSMACYRKIVSNLFGGLQYTYGNLNFSGSDSASSAKMEQQGLELGTTTESLLVPSFVWDSRDNIYWSLKGYYAGISFQFASTGLFSSYDYNIITGYVNGYHRLCRQNNRLTLAWHFFLQSGWGELPYDRLAMYGRGDNATGYTRGKYINNSEVTVQSELRYDIWNFFAVGGYAGTGKVFPTFETFGPSVWLTFGGARFYVNVMPSYNLRLRLDLSVGRKDYGVYVGIGQGF